MKISLKIARKTNIV